MRVAVITAPGEVELREEPSPRLAPDELLVEVGACGLCTMERRLFSGEKRVYPVAPGHEVAGRVVAAGEAVAALPGAPRVGERVTVDLLTRCGACSACRRGRSALCRRPQGGALSDGTISMGAGLADAVRVRAEQAYQVGEVTVEQAAMGEPVACVVHSLRLGGFGAGDRVGVIGAGYMGRLHLALMLRQGAVEAGVVDISPDRRADAAHAGAHWTATPDEARAEHAHALDTVVITAGAPGALELGLELLDEGGTVVLFGAFPKELTASVPPDALHHHEHTVVGVYSHEPRDWHVAAALIRSGVLAADLDALVTARFGLDGVGEALALAASAPVYRVLVGG
ncbi:MAG TPA: alcohol dehydrogenase catalytic domain-containing protein [Candidatus Dormibacteraeota bacterium]